MKKKILAAAVATLMLSAITAFAGLEAGSGIANSKHDMNKLGGNKDSQKRVCAFCHTPHHADMAVALDYNPLWSHTVSSATFTPYASATLDAQIDPATVVAGPSKLCMSCHDGVIAADQHYGTLFAGTSVMAGDNFGQYAVGDNGSLSNDHPIGFDYTAVAAGTNALNGTPGAGPASAGQDLYIKAPTATFIDNIDPATGNRTAVASGLTIGDRLYAGAIMTCATCHDVHNAKTINPGGGTNNGGVDAIGGLTDNKNYFLLGGQVGSAICLSCHIK